MYQFIHVESYSRTPPKAAQKTGKAGRSVRYIIDEAMRAEGAHPHIDDPQPPVILHGDSPEELESMCEEWAGSITDARGRKTRKDALCLLAGVVSAPDSIGEGWEAFKADTLDWLKKKYGDTLRSVIEHTDEAHPHLHFYVVPELGSRFETVHQGRAASADVKGQGLKKGAQNTAYKEAMREYQDQFFTDVAVKHGMARIGPGRRRLSRQEWRQEQQQVQATAVAIKIADEKMAEAHAEVEQVLTIAEQSAQGITEGAQRAATALKEQAERERLDAIKLAKEEAQDLARKAIEQVDEIQRNAEKEGFEKGLDKVESMPWYRRLTKVIFRASQQRDELKKTVDELTDERDQLKDDKRSLTARARHYLKTGRTIQQSMKDLELELTQAKAGAERVAELEIENEKLIKEVSSNRSQVQHWSAIAESYQMREQEELEKNALNDKKPRKRRDFNSEYQP